MPISLSNHFNFLRSIIMHQSKSLKIGFTNHKEMKGKAFLKVAKRTVSDISLNLLAIVNSVIRTRLI